MVSIIVNFPYTHIMAGKIHLPHPDLVAQWKEEKVIKWLRRVHLDDCIPAFEIRHVDGSKLLELTEQKLFTYQDLKIKHRKQIAKCVQECKSQASNAKRIARTIKHKNRIHPGGIDTNGDYDSGEDSDDWGSDFEDESEDEVKSDNLVTELNNNSVIHPTCNSIEENFNSNSSQEKPQQGKFIPQPPDVPVISKTINGTIGRTNSPIRNNTIPRPPIKRPPSQPPPPPIVQVPSQDIEQEDYEIPIVSAASSVKDNSELSDTSFHSGVSNEFAAETYELIEPPEETYEMVDAPSLSYNVPEKPVLPPRLPLSCSIASPPPLPQKPKKLKDSLIHERSEGVRTFSRPKPAVKADPETESSQSPATTNVGFISSLMGRRPSNTPSPSPKTEHKRSDSHDGTLSSSHSVVSSSDGLSSRSSSPDKDGSTDSKKSTPLPPLPSRGATSAPDETAQNMATRPLPPVPVPQEKKVLNNKLEDLTKYPWFHEIERQTAEEVVKDLNESGSFVVRPSKRAGIENPYSLTIFHDDKLFHLNIRIRPDNTFALGKEKKIEKTFYNVADLISFHQTDPILLTSRGEPAGKTILCKYPEKTQQ